MLTWSIAACRDATGRGRVALCGWLHVLQSGTLDGGFGCNRSVGVDDVPSHATQYTAKQRTASADTHRPMQELDARPIMQNLHFTHSRQCKIFSILLLPHRSAHGDARQVRHFRIFHPLHAEAGGDVQHREGLHPRRLQTLAADHDAQQPARGNERFVHAGERGSVFKMKVVR